MHLSEFPILGNSRHPTGNEIIASRLIFAQSNTSLQCLQAIPECRVTKLISLLHEVNMQHDLRGIVGWCFRIGFINPVPAFTIESLNVNGVLPLPVLVWLADLGRGPNCIYQLSYDRVAASRVSLCRATFLAWR